ncbi:uncharacterized protein CTRU02_203716 [Colletotrichum truncatum]|uniref:Uncharacterized protein n=1 Tax=Colletotrichum truncatum TaxID=5467 RepID=A0ACC3ZAS0_COLTU|nr:uncharacterized protein CTRU02_04050 [Colletotrichum truncatum]KAF6796090.1 hypothetical protein CTRU02_04050 [Colletotrichum truncatum]
MPPESHRLYDSDRFMFYFLFKNATPKKEEEARADAVRLHRRVSLDSRYYVSLGVSMIFVFLCRASIMDVPCHGMLRTA